MLRDFFAFPARFLGFRLEQLQTVLPRVPASAFDLLFEFDATVPRLAAIVKPEVFALYGVAAANLFEMQCSRVPMRRNEFEHQVVADRSRWLDFEVNSIVDVFAHYQGATEKVRVFPLYSLPDEDTPLGEALFYTARRLPRRRITPRFVVRMKSTR